MSHLSIGEFARASGLTAKALRLYDELELVVPAEVDEFNGYRRYAPEQLERARLVASLRLVGMPLYRIRAIVGLGAGARAAEVAAYWRQVEADHVSRRAVVSSLVEQFRAKEPTMTDTTPTWSIRSASRHEQGGRSSQRDAVYAGSAVFAVADGIGSGASAASTAIKAVASLDLDLDLDHEHEHDPTSAIVDALTRASAGIQASDSTTLTALWFRGDAAVSAHVGDCRLHRIREGQVELLTRDHTLVAALIEEGRLTDVEAQTHPHRALLNRALAPGAPGEADISAVDVRAGDRFALTSKGVHAVIAAHELATLLLMGSDLEKVAGRIADAVADAGAPDNYSVVLLELGA